MPFELPGLWTARSEWPIAPLNFVFLLDATDQIGRAMYGPNWKAPPFRGDDAENNQQFERVITNVARACESGKMCAWCRYPDGTMAQMNSEDWRSPSSYPLAWQGYFYAGEMIEMNLDLMEAPFPDEPRITDPVVPSAVSHCMIFVRREDFDRFIAETQSRPADLRSVSPQGSKKKATADRYEAYQRATKLETGAWSTKSQDNAWANANGYASRHVRNVLRKSFAENLPEPERDAFQKPGRRK
jgi:hypothetical protein